MDVIDAIHTRHSIRVFRDADIPTELIQTILEAGRAAPSAGNCQPWRFVVVTDREKIATFDPVHGQPWVVHAPAAIVVCVDPHDTYEKYDENERACVLDAAAAIENMLLAIHGLGLGGVWVAACSKRAVRRALQLPAHWEVISIIPFGYYDVDAVAEMNGRQFGNATLAPRRPLSEIAFLNGPEVAWAD